MTNPVTPLTPVQEAYEQSQAANENYIVRVLVSVDKLGNVVLMDGNSDETISSHLARMAVEDTGFKEAVGNFGSAVLDAVQKDHGADAMAGDLARAMQVTQMEQQDGILPGGAK